MCPGLDSGDGFRRTGQGHTHRTGLISKEVDDVKAVFTQAVQAVALIPALREDVEAYHASCGKGRRVLRQSPGRDRQGWQQEGSWG